MVYVYCKRSVNIYGVFVYKYLLIALEIPYDVGLERSGISRRIPVFESWYNNPLYFYTISCIVLFNIQGTGDHTPFTQTKRENIDPYGYINSLKYPPLYPIHRYH